MSEPFETRGLVLSLSLWATGLMLGAFVTAFAPMSRDNWWIFVGIRLVWQLGTALWFGIVLARLFSGLRSRAVCLAIPTAISLVVAWNPLLDVVTGGPVHVSGTLAASGTARTGGRTTAGSVWMGVQLWDDDGALVSFDSEGYQANRWEDVLEGCVEAGWDPQAGPIEVWGLVHLGIVLEHRCPASAEDGTPPQTGTAPPPP